MFLENCEILENKKISPSMYLMKIKSEKSTKESSPGQFFMVKMKNEITILRRPISLHYADKENNILEFFYEVKGKGTQELSTLKEKDFLNIQGPLGKGFSTNLKNKKILIIGGGMGLAPNKFIVEELAKNNEVIFIAGGRNKEALNILSNFNLKNIELHLTTDDGSLGNKGNVVTEMQKIILNNKIDFIMTCGPHKMMEAVAELALKNNIECEVSLEEKMACGIKACVGCSIKTLDGMKKVCFDGPVFDAKKIIDVNPIENIVCCSN